DGLVNVDLASVQTSRTAARRTLASGASDIAAWRPSADQLVRGLHVDGCVPVFGHGRPARSQSGHVASYSVDRGGGSPCLAVLSPIPTRLTPAALPTASRTHASAAGPV